MLNDKETRGECLDYISPKNSTSRYCEVTITLSTWGGRQKRNIHSDVTSHYKYRLIGFKNRKNLSRDDVLANENRGNSDHN